MASRNIDLEDSRQPLLRDFQNTSENFTEDTSDLPSYEAFARPSAPLADHEPPDYFDISIVPNSAVLYNDGLDQIHRDSQAKIKRSEKGVISFDELIDRNPDQLWIYFLTYLREKPKCLINVRGFYTEYYTTTHTTTDAHGYVHTHTEEHSREVTDFSFNIDISQYVDDRWWRVAVVPSSKTRTNDQIISVRTALEQYTQVDKQIKNIVMKKQIYGWDFDGLCQKIKNIVRSTGYSNEIKTTIKVTNNIIEARSPSKLSRFAKSTLVRILCIVSCLCIVFAPIYCCLKSVGSTRDKIVTDFLLIRPMETFLQLNSPLIYQNVLSRSDQDLVAFID